MSLLMGSDTMGTMGGGMDTNPADGTTMRPRQRRTPGLSPLGGGTGMAMPSTQQFGADSNLIGTQINPTNSRQTNQAQNWTSSAGQQYNNFQIKPFQGVQPLNFDTEKGMLNGANGQYQNLSYNFNPANTQYGNAQTQLGNAANGANASFDKAASMVGGGLSGGGGYSQAADTGQARAQTMQYLANLNGPDRSKLASDQFALLEAQSQPGFENAQRQIGQKAAAFGRVGSGITTTELGDLGLQREKNLNQTKQQLSLDTAAQTLNDRLSQLNAAQGVTQGFGSLDQNAASINDAAARATSGFQLQGADLLRGIGNDKYGMGRDQSNLSMGIGDRFGDQARDTTGLGERAAGFQRGIANDLGGMTRDTYNAGVNERDTARADEYKQGDFLGNRFDRNAGYLNQTQGQDRANRNELRGERDYQYGLSRDAVGDEMNRSQWEEQLRNGRYNRAQGTASLGFGAPSPVGTYENAANTAGNNAQDYYGAIGNFAQSYGARRRSGAGTGTRTTTSPSNRPPKIDLNFSEF